MKVLQYNTEYSQNAFGNKTGNRARKRGIYKCSFCGEEVIIWLDYGRLPACSDCHKAVKWEYTYSNIQSEDIRKLVTHYSF